jgi:hypothetical protein
MASKHRLDPLTSERACPGCSASCSWQVAGVAAGGSSITGSPSARGGGCLMSDTRVLVIAWVQTATNTERLPATISHTWCQAGFRAHSSGLARVRNGEPMASQYRYIYPIQIHPGLSCTSEGHRRAAEQPEHQKHTYSSETHPAGCNARSRAGCLVCDGCCIASSMRDPVAQQPSFHKPGPWALHLGV